MDDDVTMSKEAKTLMYASDETDSSSETFSETYSSGSDTYSSDDDTSEIYSGICFEPEGKRLIDLNADCLNGIFKYLNFADIVTVAHANLSTRRDIFEAFTQNTSARTHPYEATIRDHFVKSLRNSYVYVSNSPHFIYSFEKVIRYFGTVIPEILLHYETRYHRRHAKIEHIICEYATSLNEISLINADMSAFDSITKPLETVQHIKFEGGWISQKFCELGKWFPRLKSLQIIGTQIADPKFIERPFPNLTIVVLRNRHICQYDRVNRHKMLDDPLVYALSSVNVERFINLNPQLINLTIYHDCGEAARDTNRQPHQSVIQLNSSLLETIALNLPNLRYLKINIEECHRFNHGLEVIQFRFLKTLIVEVKRINQLRQIMNIMSNRLVHLTITLNHNLEYNVLCEFIGRFKNLGSLLIQHSPFDVQNVHFIDVMTKLTNLGELHITIQKDNIKESACFMIEKFKRLTTITIRCPEIKKEDQDLLIEDIFPSLTIHNWGVQSEGKDFIFNKGYFFRFN